MFKVKVSFSANSISLENEWSINSQLKIVPWPCGTHELDIRISPTMLCCAEWLDEIAEWGDGCPQRICRNLDYSLALTFWHLLPDCHHRLQASSSSSMPPPLKQWEWCLKQHERHTLMDSIIMQHTIIVYYKHQQHVNWPDCLVAEPSQYQKPSLSPTNDQSAEDQSNWQNHHGWYPQ